MCVCVCSTGVGQTGVFIALSVVLERMRFEGVVDMFQTVNILRTQRPSIIHTEVTWLQFISISHFQSQSVRHVRPDRSCHHDIWWTAWAVLMKLTANMHYSTGDLVRVWGERLKVKVTASRGAVEDIQFDADNNPICKAPECQKTSVADTSKYILQFVFVISQFGSLYLSHCLHPSLSVCLSVCLLGNWNNWRVDHHIHNLANSYWGGLGGARYGDRLCR